MAGRNANRLAVWTCLLAAAIAVVIWLAIAIPTGAKVKVDIVGAVAVAIFAGGIATGFSIYYQQRRGI